MRCAECALLKLDTRVSRRMAAIGYAVCTLGLTPKDEGCTSLQSWPIELLHECTQGERLTGKDKDERRQKLTRFRNFLEAGNGR